MPIHDWTRLEAGDFHDFHQSWTIGIRNALNGGLLPPDYMAMVEQVTGLPIPDAFTSQADESSGETGGVSVKESPPTAQFVMRFEKGYYARRKNRVVIRDKCNQVVAMIEIVSPGNKSSRSALRTFVEKTADILNQGIHLLIVDLFPPTSRDPQGIHKALWDEFGDEPFELLPNKPLTVAAYVGGDVPTAYVEPVAVGDPLPSLPIFLSEEWYIPAPLEATYMEAWRVYPAMLKELIEGPARA